MISKDLRTARIREVMARQTPIAASATLREAAARLQNSPVDALIVRLDDGLVAGVLTERSLVFAAHHEEEGRVGDYVDAKFVRVDEDEPVEDVLAKMDAAESRRAMVFDDDENPTGLIAPERPGFAVARGRADFVLEVDGERFGASIPEVGDSTRDEANPAPRISIGVTASAAPRLANLTGRKARLLSNPLLDRTGKARELAKLRLLKVDVDEALVVCALEPRTASPTTSPQTSR